MHHPGAPKSTILYVILEFFQVFLNGIKILLSVCYFDVIFLCQLFIVLSFFPISLLSVLYKAEQTLPFSNEC